MSRGLSSQTVDGDQYPEDDSTTRDSPGSPPTAGISFSRRRPSEAATLVAPSSPNTLGTLFPSKDDPARSRSSSFGAGSMYSGATTVMALDSQDEMPYDRKIDASSLPKESSDSFDDKTALDPYPGTEADFVVDNNPFAFTPGELNKFLNPKSLAAFKAVGGIRGLEAGLRTDLTAGLSLDESALEGRVSFADATGAARPDMDHADRAAAARRTPTGATTAQPRAFVDRKRVFRDNSLPAKKAKSIWRLMWEQYNDKILILLTAAAVVSLALGLYESLGVQHMPGDPPAVDWIEGVAICVAIIIVVMVGSLNDWQKERQFVKLNAKVCHLPAPTYPWGRGELLVLTVAAERGS